MLGGIGGRRRRGRRGWDGWMVSPTWWTWVWASSRSWWWKGKPGVLQSMGSQRFGHDWETELNWTHGCTRARLALDCPLDSCWNPSWGNPTENQRARESGPLRSAYHVMEPSGAWIFRSGQENIQISSTMILRSWYKLSLERWPVFDRWEISLCS